MSPFLLRHALPLSPPGHPAVPAEPHQPHFFTQQLGLVHYPDGKSVVSSMNSLQPHCWSLKHVSTEEALQEEACSWAAEAHFLTRAPERAVSVRHRQLRVPANPGTRTREVRAARPTSPFPARGPTTQAPKTSPRALRAFPDTCRGDVKGQVKALLLHPGSLFRVPAQTEAARCRQLAAFPGRALGRRTASPGHAAPHRTAPAQEGGRSPP